MDYLTNLFADYPIKKINYIEKNFDIDNYYLEDAINDYLEENNTNQIKNFLDSLEKNVQSNNADMIKKYLHSQGR